MVNEDVKPPSSPSSPDPPSPSQNVPGDSGPTMVKTGEIMLIFALVIIFLVILFVACHLTMKKGGKWMWKNRNKKTKKKPNDVEAQSSSELHAADKNVFEVAGAAVVLCELPGHEPPRQEMEADSISSPVEARSSSSASTLDVEVSPAENPWPEGRQLAVYWSARL